MLIGMETDSPHLLDEVLFTDEQRRVLCTIFAEGFVQGYAKQTLVNMCQLVKKQDIPLSEIAESYQVTERELKDLYTAFVSENKVNIQ